ncbi:MAG TPA: PP2C family protein-serine/threonine phosphatase [Phycisphaerales bacterium]|nr:PP2C family protein-serine/threonine phosphatase [Phycisphaerales bacterium]
MALIQTPTAHAPSDHTMQCMEVWGGNRSIDAGVKMSGLDAWVYSRPFSADGGEAGPEAGGGDIHYLSSCMTGRISRMLVADVSGHGRAVDSTAVALRDLMRRYVNFLDQSRLVESLNVEFGNLARMGVFATAIAATYWAPSSYLVATNAGHPRPLVYRARTGQWQFLQPDTGTGDVQAEARAVDAPTNLPLGVLEPTRYDQMGIRLETGDMVLIYTDSVIESRSREGKLLGDMGLLDIVQGLDPRSPADLVPALVKTLELRQGGASFSDDLTCLLLRRNEEVSRVRLYDVLTGLARVLGQGAAILTGRKTPLPWPEVRLETVGGILFERLNRRWKGGVR